MQKKPSREESERQHQKEALAPYGVVPPENCNNYRLRLYDDKHPLRGGFLICRYKNNDKRGFTYEEQRCFRQDLKEGELCPVSFFVNHPTMFRQMLPYFKQDITDAIRDKKPGALMLTEELRRLERLSVSIIQKQPDVVIKRGEVRISEDFGMLIEILLNQQLEATQIRTNPLNGQTVVVGLYDDRHIVHKREYPYDPSESMRE